MKVLYKNYDEIVPFISAEGYARFLDSEMADYDVTHIIEAVLAKAGKEQQEDLLRELYNADNSEKELNLKYTDDETLTIVFKHLKVIKDEVDIELLPGDQPELP